MELKQEKKYIKTSYLKVLMNLKKLAGLAKNKNKREMTNYQNQKRKSRHGGLKTLAKNILCNHSNPTIGNYQDLPGRPH